MLFSWQVVLLKINSKTSILPHQSCVTAYHMRPLLRWQCQKAKPRKLTKGRRTPFPNLALPGRNLQCTVASASLRAWTGSLNPRGGQALGSLPFVRCLSPPFPVQNFDAGKSGRLTSGSSNATLHVTKRLSQTGSGERTRTNRPTRSDIEEW